MPIIRTVFASLLALAVTASAPTRAQIDESGIAARIAQAVAMAGAVRRCQLPSDLHPFTDFETFWQREIIRSRGAIVEKLKLSEADADRLVAPMREVHQPFTDSTPAADVQDYCRAQGMWKNRPDLLVPSQQFAAGKFTTPKPIEWQGRDDAAVLKVLSAGLHPWEVFISCNSTTMNYFVTMPSHWNNFRRDAIEVLRKFHLSPRAKLAAYRMLDFDHLFAPGRGSWGELKSYCAANGQLLKDSADPDKKIMVQPAQVLRALEPAPALPSP